MMLRRRVWMILAWLLLFVSHAQAYSSNYCEQLMYVQGGLSRFQVGVPFSVALSSNPGVTIASTITDNNGWGCLCLSQSRNYHVNRNGVISPDEFIAVADLVGVGACASNATPTPTRTPTPSVTVTPTAGTPTRTPTPSATSTPSGCTNTIQQTGVIGDFWTAYNILTDPANGGTHHAKQRVQNSTSKTIQQVTLCLGKASTTGGSDSVGNGTGKFHVEIWSDQVGGCDLSEPYCPDAELGISSSMNNSFPAAVTMCKYGNCSPTNLACGDAGNDRGAPYTFVFSSPPTVSGNFWILIKSDTGADQMTGQTPRWATYLINDNSSYPAGCSEPTCTDYNAWRGSETSPNNEHSDYWFQVCTQ